MAMALTMTACGGEDPATTAADEEVTTSTPSTTGTSGTSTSTSTDDATTTSEAEDDLGGLDLGPLQRCDDVAPLTGDPDLRGSLPATANIEDEVMGVVVTYSQEIADVFAGLWVDRSRDGVIVVAVTDDPAPHQEALLARGPSPDDVAMVEPRPPIADPRPLGDRDDIVLEVVPATFTEAELAEQQNELFREPPEYVFSGGTDVIRNRNTIDLLDPTPDQLADLTERVNPELFCVNVTLTPTVPEGPLSVLPEAGGEPSLVCDSAIDLSFPPSVLDERPSPRSIDHPAAEAAVSDLIELPPSESSIDGPEISEDWFVLAIGRSRALFGLDRGATMHTATFTRSGGGWQLAGWTTGCQLSVAIPEGLSLVEITLDPAFGPPGPDDTEIHLLATEQGCNDGQDMGDRLQGPQVIETDDAVTVAFAVLTRYTPATCPGNPSTPVTIDLAAPLGDRPVLDGLTYPPTPLTTPDDDG